MDHEIRINHRFNFTINVLDGAFFGAALGFASFVTVIPLFVSQMTNSAVLIGLIPTIHIAGWQLPQLLVAGKVSRLKWLKPMVLFVTIHERLPFLGLAGVAWLLPAINPEVALLLTFGLLIWQGFGGGFTALGWQSLIAKVIYPERLGTFFGVQSAAANLLASVSAVVAGAILEQLDTPVDFTLCFLFAGLSMAISWLFLAQTREPERSPEEIHLHQGALWGNLRIILQQDKNFRWFLITRMLYQPATMAFAFYTVYAVRKFGMSEGTVGLMTAIHMAVMIAANPIMGWLGDRYGHRASLQVGILAAMASAGLAWLASGTYWFFPVFALAGITNVATWTVPIAMTLEFGQEEEKAAYIGLANTLVAPSAIVAPLLGGWLADHSGYPTTFLASVIAGLITILVVSLAVRDPRLRIVKHPVVTDQSKVVESK